MGRRGGATSGAMYSGVPQAEAQGSGQLSSREELKSHSFRMGRCAPGSQCSSTLSTYTR